MLIAVVRSEAWPMNVEFHYVKWDGQKYVRSIRRVTGSGTYVYVDNATPDDVAYAFAVGIGCQRPLSLVMA